MTEVFPSQRIAANGLMFHYVTSGPKDGPPILLLHGFPEFWYSWRHQLAALAAAGYRAIAPDLRGYNLSDKPQGVRPYRITELITDVPALVRALGYERVTLVGHDWGGAIAWSAAAAPQTSSVVQRLVVLNAPHPNAFLGRLTLRQLRKSWYMFFFQLPWLPETSLSENHFARIERAFRYTSKVPGAFSDEDVAAYKEALAQPGALTAALNYYRAMFRVNLFKFTKMLRPIEVPTLLIWGEDDIALGKELTYDMAPWVRDLRTEYLPNTGHWVQQERPAEVNRILLEFLQN